MALRITIFNEGYHERFNPISKEVYPNGMHDALVKAFDGEDVEIRYACQYEENCGLTEEILENTDVLIWWAHVLHNDLPDEIAQMVQRQVLKGMGLIALHSAHYSKPFRLLMGTSCSLRCHDVGERERLWVIEPGHPIVQGIPPYFELKHEEMYGERFDVPAPDELILGGWFQSGEIFRSGCVWRRGYGKVFYFQPGHETYATYREYPYILKIIRNAAHYVARPANLNANIDCIFAEELERVPDCDRIEY